MGSYTSLLENKNDIKLIESVVNEILEIENNTYSPVILWDTVNCKIRGESIKYLSNLLIRSLR